MNLLVQESDPAAVGVAGTAPGVGGAGPVVEDEEEEDDDDDMVMDGIEGNKTTISVALNEIGYPKASMIINKL